eukprot:GFUD01000277.1.p1 GENE.GFUD01000277.1~~GFUD01000277.1.p1  ORF type:complete len:107 (+),score=15.66 GFUD01000277.1:67-387(+)
MTNNRTVTEQPQQPERAATVSQGNIRISQANCRKLFIPRDYSEGSGVRFQPRYLPELEGKIDRQMFDYTVNTLNSLYAEAETANCSTYCEGKKHFYFIQNVHLQTF